MLQIPGVNHLEAIKALKKAGFKVVRQGRKPTVMSAGIRFLSIPRKNLVKALTRGGIVRDAGLNVEEFLKLI